jgi:antibiotic biosynthesis monooxygenase (ABM) superfamily enzyme
VGVPLLADKLAMPFPIALFVGNVVSVVLTGYLVPRVATRFDWWLQPANRSPLRTNVLGAVVILALYAVMVVVFWRLL